MLKILSAILSVYFLTLSAVPCTDGSDPVQVKKEMCADHDHSGNEHPSGEEPCTPLCACQCCHTNVTFAAHINPDEALAPVQAIITFYSEHPYTTYFAPLLDPPQV